MIPQRQVRPGWGRLIREAREGRNLTQRDLGEAIGMDHSRISHLENENWQPNLDDIYLLCTALGIWPEQVFAFLGLPLILSASGKLPKDLLEAWNGMSDEVRPTLLAIAKSLSETHPRKVG